jgi:EpsI family protein
MAERRAFLGAGLMGAAALLGAAKPHPHKDPRRTPLHLDADVPHSFGSWSQDSSTLPLLPTPDLQAKLDHIYNQQLVRTYRNEAGREVMLLVAYGEDQLELTTQTHLPEVCYPSQGFDILRYQAGRLDLGRTTLPVVRMFARAPGRSEPLTYWITMGDAVLRDEFERRYTRVRYNLTGVIPDGMLVRVSCIDDDAERAWRLQAAFLRELYSALALDVRRRIFGSAASAGA